MINAYSPDELATKYGRLIDADEDPARWFRRRMLDGRIPCKRLSRNVVVMTDKHIEEWLNGNNAPGEATPVESVEPVSIVDGLSARRRAS